MAAYLVADLEVTNPNEFQKYGEKVVATVKQYGGRYLIRGGDVQVLEGVSKSKLAIIGFRHRAAAGSLLIVHGGVAV